MRPRLVIAALVLSLFALGAHAAHSKVRAVDDATGKPIETFTVTVTTGSQPSTGTKEIRSRRGEATLRDLPEGTALLVRAPGYVQAHAAVPSAAASATPVEVRLQRAVTYRGRVTTADGNPIPGVAVMIDGGAMTPGAEPAATTDPKGEFSVVLPAAYRSFRFVREGMSEERLTPTGTGSEIRTDVVLAPTVSLSGIAKDDAGTPVAGARVRAISEVRTGEIREAKTDEEGRFTLEGLRAGAQTIELTKRGYAPRAVAGVVAPQADALALTVDRGATVTGRVKGATEEEEPYLMVYVGSVITGINREGIFGILGAPPGKTRVYAEYASDGLLRRSEPFFVEIANGVPTEVAIELRDQPVLDGTVREGGKAVARAVVTVTGGTMAQARVVTDDMGSFRIVGLPAGTFTVAVEGRTPDGAMEVTLPREEPLELVVGPIAGRDLPGLPPRPEKGINPGSPK